MNRVEILEKFAVMLAIPSAAVRPLVQGDEPPFPALAEFRYVVPVGPYRVGLLSDVGAIYVGQRGSTRTSTLNLPRPTKGTEGWHAVSAPSAPYHNPERRTGDVILDAGPDKVTAAATVGPNALFGMSPPADLVPRSYLVSVIPATLALRAMWLPRSFDGDAIAFFPKSEKLGVIDMSGNVVLLDYPR